MIRLMIFLNNNVDNTVRLPDVSRTITFMLTYS